jgi:hypothetical protein
MRGVTHLIERTIDRDGQMLLIPKLEIEGWLTSLELPVAQTVALYQANGTNEQFHSEFNTDLDLERPPSDKFATNDLVLSLAMLAFNILCSIGQATLIEPDSPFRHPAKRRRLRTVMQEIIGIVARVIAHARLRPPWAGFSAVPPSASSSVTTRPCSSASAPCHVCSFDAAR